MSTAYYVVLHFALRETDSNVRAVGSEKYGRKGPAHVAGLAAATLASVARGSQAAVSHVILRFLYAQELLPRSVARSAEDLISFWRVLVES
jgi:hypothetical protein